MKNECSTTSTASMPKRTREEVEAIIRSNLALIKWCISKYAPGRLTEADRDELFAACLPGLWLAAEQYDPSRGMRFSTFAVPKIRGKISAWLSTRNRKKRKFNDDTLSLSMPLHHGEAGGETLEDILPDPGAEFESRIIARDEIERLLASCTERERRILCALGDGFTLQITGDMEGGISRERVRQIRNRATKKVQTAVR